MTAATVSQPGTEVVFGRAAAAEWLRLRTVRTTWLCLLAAAAAIVGIGVPSAVDEAEMAGAAGFPAASAA